MSKNYQIQKVTVVLSTCIFLHSLLLILIFYILMCAIVINVATKPSLLTLITRQSVKYSCTQTHLIKISKTTTSSAIKPENNGKRVVIFFLSSLSYSGVTNFKIA